MKNVWESDAEGEFVFMSKDFKLKKKGFPLVSR